MDEKEVNKYLGIYQEIADIVGDEMIEEIHNHFQGLQITFPRRLYSTKYVVEIARKEKNNMRQIAQQYGYSERYLKDIVNKTK